VGTQSTSSNEERPAETRGRVGVAGWRRRPVVPHAHDRRPIGTVSGRVATRGMVPAVFVGAAVVLAVRVATWPAGIGFTGWSYAAWGRMLGRGQLHLASTGIYPKPIAYLLGVVVAPFAPDRAIPLVTACAMAAIVASLWKVGHDTGGALGATATVTGLVATVGFAHGLQWASIDVITAGFVALSLATRGRTRVTMLVLAGLGRPEAWPVAGAAGLLEAGRRGWLMRIASGAAGLVAAPAIWGAVDLLLWGTPFAFLRDLNGNPPGIVAFAPTPTQALAAAVLGPARSFAVALGAAAPRLGYLGPGAAVRALWSATAGEAGAAIVVAGSAGLVVVALQAVRRRGDPLPAITAAIWAVALAVELQHGLLPYLRYTFPLAVLLIAGLGPIAGLLWRRRGRVFDWVAVAACLAVTAGSVAAMPPDTPRQAVQADLVRASLPQLRAVLGCGPMGMLTAHTRYSRIAAIVSTLADTSLNSLPAVHDPAVVGQLPSLLRQNGVSMKLPPGPTVQTPIGTIRLSASCAATIRTRAGSG
jgi:hypothetical protein